MDDKYYNIMTVCIATACAAWMCLFFWIILGM